METTEQEVVTEQEDIFQSEEEERERYFNFSEARRHLQQIVNDWKNEVDETEIRRNLRDVEIDVEALREKGDTGEGAGLDEDETLIPVRVIDTNITREQPPYINYLKNSRRLATFRSLNVPGQDTQALELAYTQAMTYNGWEIPHYKCLDGAQVHGWDAVEVVLNYDNPGNVGIEHIGHDMLFFPQSIKDIQQSSIVLRAYDVTVLQLKKYVKDFGFDPIQVQKLLRIKLNTQQEFETIRVYKQFCKHEGIVYVAWFSLEQGCDDWLKAPQPLFLGIKEKKQIVVQTPQGPMPQEEWQDSPITQYPIFVLNYRETEQPKAVDHKGRGFLDENKQEAHTAILSGYVNGLTRASNIYASPKTEDGSGGSLKEIQNVKLVAGRIMNKPIEYWHPDYPDPQVLAALRYLSDFNAEEVSQVNFAAMNRRDSRKTATEITAAQTQQSLLNSVQLTLFSTYVRGVYSFAWLIVQSQAMQGKIAFLVVPIQEPIINELTGQPVLMPNGQPQVRTIFQNNFDVIGQVYDVRAAGDVDVIQRQEKISQMKQDWPVVSQTALRDEFLAELIKLQYPDTGERWAQILQQNGQMIRMQGMIGRLSTVLSGAMQAAPEAFNNLSAQDKSDLNMMLQEANQLVPQPQQQ